MLSCIFTRVPIVILSDSESESDTNSDDTRCSCDKCASKDVDVDDGMNEMYHWEMEVTRALASRKKAQVLVFVTVLNSIL
ncbi:unnamed protein product [Trifolium pratense]|uniref:Uncharacterized protein n=1 Tax=Trifolium pratense TaxID=57577 RepID=A0ACB0JS90_TRIPR|nr:unnamed protein product [Trifolium pratense]